MTRDMYAGSAMHPTEAELTASMAAEGAAWLRARDRMDTNSDTLAEAQHRCHCDACRPVASLDFTIYGGGTVYLVTPQNAAAREYLSDMLDESASWLGRGLAVEWRFLDGLVEALRDAGYSV